MSGRAVGFGLIGCGGVAPHHVAAISGAANARLVMVADADRSAADALGAQFGVPVAAGVDELLTSADVEAVSVATPPDTLAELACRAACAGKHVIVEKPMARTSDEGRRLVGACADAHVALSVWYERRYQPFAVQARTFLRDGGLGDVFLASMHTLGWKTAGYWTEGLRRDGGTSTWRSSTARSGGGVLATNTCHQLDLLLHVSGLEITEVFARTATVGEDVEVENVAVASLLGSRGELVNVVASSRVPGAGRYPAQPLRDLLVGTAGSLLLGVPLECSTADGESWRLDLDVLDLTECKMRAVSDFARAIVDDVPPPITPEEAMTVLSVLEAAYESAHDGRPVGLREPRSER